jgi:DNA-directed RNA polymerase
LDLTTDYIKIDTITYSKNNKFTIIFPGKTIEELIDISLMDVSMLPMICKPNEWSVTKKVKKVKNSIINLKNNIKKEENYENKKYEFVYMISKYGGYLLNNFEHNHFIHKNPINDSIIKLINEDIINTINYIQSVPFQINLNVLHHILNLIIDNKHLDDPFFFNIHNETKKLDEYKKNRELSKVNEILRQNSIANTNLATLSAAILLRKTTFYNPIYTDWRGRIFCNNTLLSFQGSELNRSLLYFNNGNTLNEKGLESLKIYTANCFGFSKMSLNFRINWVNNNIKSILNIESNLWLEAKEKLLFLACAYELIEYYKDPQNFISRLPIYLDATASGLQHLSVMTKDLNLARYVNILKSTNNENPHDIYSLIAKKVNDIINKFPDFSINALLKKLAIEENREFTKWPVMTTSYGVTLRGIKDQLISNIFIKTDEKYRYNVINNKKNLEKVTNMYKLKDKKFLKEEFQDEFEIYKLKGTEIMNLAKIIHNTLYDSYPSLKLLVKYLHDINNFLNEISLEIGIVWNTPSGLNLEQRYLETISEQRTKNILGRRKSYSIQKTIPKINKLKQKRSTMPNLIHSMDAGNISLLVNIIINTHKNINLVTVHDCFITDSNNIDMIHFHVRLAFLRIYQNQDFIENFHNNIIKYLKNLGIKFNNENNKIYLNDDNTLDIPKKPNFKDNLDLSYNLFNSPYFIN